MTWYSVSLRPTCWPYYCWYSFSSSWMCWLSPEKRFWLFFFLYYIDIHTILIFYFFQASMLTLSSTLVETVSIDYEDFNESFLTCGTCLNTFDSSLQTPKLLPCSHTICLECLTRIVATFARDSQFRCPICRWVNSKILWKKSSLTFAGSWLLYHLVECLPSLPPSWWINYST